MDINSVGNGKFTVIKTSLEFVLIIGENIIGPFPNTKESVKRVYGLMESIKNS